MNITPNQYAKSIINEIKEYGSCYDLIPENMFSRLRVHYVVDRDRMGWGASYKDFGIELPFEFRKKTAEYMEKLLTNQETSGQTNYIFGNDGVYDRT